MSTQSKPASTTASLVTRTTQFGAGSRISLYPGVQCRVIKNQEMTTIAPLTSSSPTFATMRESNPRARTFVEWTQEDGTKKVQALEGGKYASYVERKQDGLITVRGHHNYDLNVPTSDGLTNGTETGSNRA